MVTINKAVSLKALNSFGISAEAEYFAAISGREELQELIDDGWLKKMPFLILGGGSNILFSGDFAGIVLKIENKGIEVIETNEDFVKVRAAAGENWHEFVLWCIEKGFGGLENLSLIPGNVGSSPIQNIGAYGTELKDSFYSLEAIDIHTGQPLELDRKACRFGYRDSIFKHELKEQAIIWSVTFRLERNPLVQLEYGAVSQELAAMNIVNPGIREVSEAICRIRRAKLPDPAVIGNAGSFFKNPVISGERAEMLKAAYPGLVCYYLPEGSVKLAAGWLIEQCRWKGFRRADAGVHEKQALVLVNYGQASGEEILALSEQIRQSVLERFDVLLDIEVNIIRSSGI